MAIFNKKYDQSIFTPLETAWSKSSAHDNSFKIFSKKSKHQISSFELRCFDDVVVVADNLKNKKSVIINLSRFDKKDVNYIKIINFLSGIIYSLDGQINKIESGIFLLSPNNIGYTQYLGDKEY
ncbi:cell division protein SepF [Mycoplasma sp. SG1]|uniref:cell division protein SepF n=1 Tax=Mycoplasma sp. SG1 TaxID=2810348 RepID=UPI0020252D2D|nr:cell division protein SepF [Mycoplasma sp. SG1]URM53181.1 cell division protein SepF [Mycoplasma sp. SG1]